MIAVLLSLIPWAIELVADALLIKRGKRDLSVGIRILMIALVSLDFSGELVMIGPSFDIKQIVLSVSWFAFFDPVLNLLRGLKVDYNGQTKWYDKMISKVPFAVQIICRILFFSSCLYFVI